MLFIDARQVHVQVEPGPSIREDCQDERNDITATVLKPTPVGSYSALTHTRHYTRMVTRVPGSSN